MAEHNWWYELFKDFQPAIAAVIALIAAGVAYVAARIQSKTALKVASDQIREQRRKQDDQLLRLRSAATIKMAFLTGGVIKDFEIRKNALDRFAEARQNSKSEWLYRFSKDDPHWNHITTVGSIGQKYPIFDKGTNLQPCVNSVSKRLLGGTQSGERIRRNVRAHARVREG